MTDRDPLRRTPTVREVDGRLVIDWPNPKPRSFEITAEGFQELVDRVNGEYSPVDAIYRTFRDATGKPPHDLRTPWWRRKRGH